ncbi:MAG: hypothetical protein P4L56_13665 [Candidatus Sulfopaludibacter sp.]|nr:hypothetical protein [Candidatus Sulfopaludibacter sp.]
MILVLGAAYIVVLREPGSLFFPFAALIFIAAPLIGATIAALKAYTNKTPVFLRAAGAVFALAALSFILTYAIYPASQRTSLLLPASCGSFAGAQPPASFVYDLPGVGPATLVTSDARSALVAAIDFRNPPFPSTVYLVRKSDNHILWSAHFANDLIAAKIDDRTLYIYNDKLGFWIDSHTGLPERKIFTIDNYGGISQSDRPVIASAAATGRWYMETSAMISSWNQDGSVVPRRRLIFNGTAFNCYINGSTRSVEQLWSP